MHNRWMKTLRMSVAAALGAAAMAAGAPANAAGPNDPVCIMDFDSYCTYYEGHVYNTPGYYSCFLYWREVQRSGDCDL